MGAIRQRLLALICALAVVLAACGEGAEVQPPAGTAGPDSEGGSGSGGSSTSGPPQGTGAPTVVVAPPGDGGPAAIPTRDQRTPPSTAGTPAPAAP